MEVGMRFYGQSRESFQELDEATRINGSLHDFVEIVEASKFNRNGTVDQLFVKVGTRPFYRQGREVVSLEMVGELFAIFGHFPSVSPKFSEREKTDIRDGIVALRAGIKEIQEGPSGKHTGLLPVLALMEEILVRNEIIPKP